MIMITARSLRGRCPEPHLSPHLAIAPDDSPGDVHRPSVLHLEGGGAGGGPRRQVIKNGDMDLGMLRLENVMILREESIHWMIVKWIMEMLREWIMVFEEISKEIKRIGRMEMRGISVVSILRVSTTPSSRMTP